MLFCHSVRCVTFSVPPEFIVRGECLYFQAVHVYHRSKDLLECKQGKQQNYDNPEAVQSFVVLTVLLAFSTTRFAIPGASLTYGSLSADSVCLGKVDILRQPQSTRETD